MVKKILLIVFFFIFSCVLSFETFSASIKVEDIFSDINSNYKYLHELQTLYDNGIIKLSSDGKFNPYELLKRDDFVGISLKVSCKDCVAPNADVYYTNKYNNSSFYDVDMVNKNYYCIEDAYNNGYIKGYDTSYTCDDGTYLEGKIPFCPNNTIILEEALTIILRVSGILTNSEAEQVRQDIKNGKITKSLSSDVHPKNSDGSVYSFYPDFLKALEYEIVEYDSLGNKITYNLIEVINDKLEPKKSINKEEFLHIAFATLKASSCIKKDLGSFALKMNVLDKSCNESDTNCSFSGFDKSEYTYDFEPIIGGDLGDNGLCIWNYYNSLTKNEIIKYGFYVNDFSFPSNGSWKVTLTCVDDNGNSNEVYNYLSLGDTDTLNSYIVSDGVEGDSPYKLDLTSYTSGGDGNYTYERDYGDGNSGFGENTTYIYKDSGVYDVVLKITDDNGQTSSSSFSVQVLGNGLTKTTKSSSTSTSTFTSDTDSDGISDLDDDCPIIVGVIDNNGCPIFDSTCSSTNPCSNGYDCSISNSGLGVCVPQSYNNDCNTSNKNFIFGNSVCNTCPCSNELDFIAILRNCDIIFPAITSPDGTDIYGLGDKFQIK